MEKNTQKKIETRKCAVCGEEFTCRSDSERKYCSIKCSWKTRPHVERHHICLCCGKDYIDNRVESKYCSRKCFGEANRKAEIKCPVCQKMFRPVRGKDTYCSPQCFSYSRIKREIIKCDMCGKEMSITPALKKKHKHHFCCKNCYDSWLAEHSELKGVLTGGGIYHHGHGYIFLYQSSHNYKAEHRLVMEQYLGRPLRSDEIVHHKDGNKQNNDISNLEIVTRAEHIEIHRSELLEAREKARRRGKNV